MARRAYLLAHPVGHSLSPRMHGAGFRALGLDATYEGLDVLPERLGTVVAALARDPAFLGANVTTPHKRAVMAHVDDLTPAADAVGAVNTLVPKGGGLLGDNTDVAGFLAALDEAGYVQRGGHAVVLGAGGAANAVAYALSRRGVRTVVAARRAAAAEELVTRLGGGGTGAGAAVVAVGPTGLAVELPGAELLVNATTVGMVGGPAETAVPLDVDVGLLPEGALVHDLVYNPRITPLLAAAAARGLTAVDGLSMLVWQGAEAARLWTGLEPPVGAMRVAVEAQG